jgi:hypothetical protein
MSDFEDLQKQMLGTKASAAKGEAQRADADLKGMRRAQF